MNPKAKKDFPAGAWQTDAEWLGTRLLCPAGGGQGEASSAQRSSGRDPARQRREFFQRLPRRDATSSGQRRPARKRPPNQTPDPTAGRRPSFFSPSRQPAVGQL